MKNFFNKIIKFAKGVVKMVKKLSADAIIKCEETIRKTVDNSDYIIKVSKGMSKVVKADYYKKRLLNDRIGFACTLTGILIGVGCAVNGYFIDKEYKLKGELENE